MIQYTDLVSDHSTFKKSNVYDLGESIGTYEKKIQNVFISVTKFVSIPFLV